MDCTQNTIRNFTGSIAIGPLVGLPSSDWVGEDVANYLLSQNVRITKFNDFNSPIVSDYIIVVKLMPSVAWLMDKANAGIKVLYAPVDIFHSPYVFWQYKERLKLFSGFLLHNDRVGKLVSKTATAPQFPIEHYLKYQIHRDLSTEKQQELLWIGHLEYIPSLIHYLKESHLRLRIRALTDLEKLPAYEDYLEKSLHKLCIPYMVTNKTNDSAVICGVYVEQWTEQKQADLMTSCVAAFDTKIDSFAYNLKPPTKAQQFIYNKLPFACSEASYSFEYFKQLGLKVAKLTELDYLLSGSYSKKIAQFCDAERWRVDMKIVGASYINACQNAKLPPKFSTFMFFLMNSLYFFVYLSLRLVDKITTLSMLKIIKRVIS
ncbi:hypothetical protein FX988_01514 [Paraglaciecola mesophila]|uniref:Uncharacterized protein n=1 Tax=Paraglaciecola mesophila TaxID=197222 RepID=A0A857JI26_9ALTE|nr:hypothetical protein [Paraglaciecola mesophila]QHJ11286.1 hypothetical protein FX988_01514 [Paraglaciecola mesophila]